MSSNGLKAFGICMCGVVVAAMYFFGLKEALRPGLLLLFAFCLVWAGVNFQKWTKKNEERRE